ncbi:MAG: ASCH domain-containing protein [Nitrospinae bacterium]|nr:ASCH domain-containing protein [Nitrospinota bacterium]
MARKPNTTIALLSIRPQYAKSILTGDKKVEFRKVKFRNNISYVVVYATNPIQQIICYFEVSYIDEDVPSNLWSKYNNVGGIRHDDFISYFQSSEKGTAIGVGKIKILKKPIPLSHLNKNLRAPQSFLYLSEKDFNKIS